MVLSTVEITLRTLENYEIFTKVEEKSQALACTANSSFFAIYMKGNVIKIYDTSTGALLVPYHLSNLNLIFLSSNIKGALAFIDVAGKLTLINVFQKKLVFETTSVFSLIDSLTK
jgi:hypothetical protein